MDTGDRGHLKQMNADHDYDYDHDHDAHDDHNVGHDDDYNDIDGVNDDDYCLTRKLTMKMMS